MPWGQKTRTTDKIFDNLDLDEVGGRMLGRRRWTGVKNSAPYCENYVISANGDRG